MNLKGTVKMGMTLKELFAPFECRVVGIDEVSAGQVAVTSVTCDSREVSSGSVFVALKGEASDGADFIRDAVGAGAVAVVMEQAVGQAINKADHTQVIVDDARLMLALLSARIYGNSFLSSPDLKTLDLKTIGLKTGALEIVDFKTPGFETVGITGTNGKTTVAYLVESVLKQAGLNTGLIGTINYRYGSTVIPAPLTTPEAPRLQRLLSAMTDGGVTHCVMEVSSHALAQKRVVGCSFDVKVFTNLTPEHLDYHKNIDEYKDAKALLFTANIYGAGSGVSVINQDDETGRWLLGRIPGKLISYSMEAGADIFPERESCSITTGGVKATLRTPGGNLNIDSSLVGDHNLYNIMAAVGAGLALGLTTTQVEGGINALHAVPGRLERVKEEGAGTKITAYVDYAHTPDALEKTLFVIGGLMADSSESHIVNESSRIITVFGCGGNRDKTKRPLMGEIAARLSDVSIVTSDNPREEDPCLIIEDIKRGMEQSCELKADSSALYNVPGSADNSVYVVIQDRQEAIKKAVRIARPGDTILIAGKGHEDYQILKGKTIAFDDRVFLEESLQSVK